MRQVFTIGETVLDIIFKDFNPTTAKAGGSVLNATVSLGRLAIPVKFITEFGNDPFGQHIEKFLIENNIDTSLVYRYSDGKTSVSLALLDNFNNATYTFYKEFPKKRLQINYQNINEGDIILFGSHFAINEDVHNQIIGFLKFAKSKGAIVIYDPNYRRAHLHELSKLIPMITENMQLADIVRGSNEDFMMIFEKDNFEEVYNEVKKFCPFLIYTISDKSVGFQTNNFKNEIKVGKIETLSTIGAGDNFNAGLVFGIYKNNLNLNNLKEISKEKLEEIISYSVRFAQNVCQSYENYISKEFAQKIIAEK